MHQDQAGFVLVTVLVMLALIAGVIGAVTRIVTLDVRAQHQLDDALVAQLQVDGVARYVAWDVANQPSSTTLRAGDAWQCRQGTTIIQVVVRPAQGLIDLNAASPSLLKLLLVGLGEPPERAERLAAAITDFRDADDARHVNGAERAQYRLAGLAHTPKNAPFEMIAELDQVLGMDFDLLRRLEPFVTVYSGLATVDRISMPPALTTTLKNRSDVLANTPTHAVRISVTAHHGKHTLAARTMTAVLDRRKLAGFRTVAWLVRHGRRYRLPLRVENRRSESSDCRHSNASSKTGRRQV